MWLRQRRGWFGLLFWTILLVEIINHLVYSSNGVYVLNNTQKHDDHLRGTRVDVVVAKDGSGQFRTINGAVNAAPDYSNTRFVIYVKAGVYHENVVVGERKSDLTIIGDGMDATIVAGNLSYVEGYSLTSTATFAVFGKDFIAQDMGFHNTAGAARYQAVALVAAGDRGAFYRCKMVGYQDTLYARSNRQFFRDCAIYGTVDFIFGDSAAVFQNCTIRPRKPLPGQFNAITAQGRADPSSKTGFSFQNCVVSPAENLAGVKTFLGRPWRNHSRVVFTNTYMHSFIDPNGWVPWSPRDRASPDTVYYAEFGNYGGGAATAGRVRWKGLHLGMSSEEVSMFSAESFIDGSSWIIPRTTDVTFNSSSPNS